MFYEDYLPSAPKYEFEGVQDCLQILDLAEPDYDPSFNQLPIRLPSGPHEVAITAFDGIFRDWKGIGDERYPLISTATQSVRSSAGKFKSPDFSWTPMHSGRDTEWPSIVLESIWSEPRAKAANDMRFWLTQSAGQSIEVGRFSFNNERRETPVQTIDVVRKLVSTRKKVQGHMHLAFEDINYRSKRKKPDKDFILTDQDMEAIAKQVWLVRDQA
ncbi:hypothetical protein N7447_009594 [Penicillium robsamsonii]|uniref:uncharacterized protein n=1 Tax=Penicillium robsamsonii TaxID=1792511 RepID=UPI002548B9A2|nr:uncharacterized protein N7447_009594 [Penicillium robsamsonii]KAJ5817361.1 hypothetical protein N7447_009594 [Penicillium robsamsonii]